MSLSLFTGQALDNLSLQSACRFELSPGFMLSQQAETSIKN